MKWYQKLIIITVLTGAVVFVVEHKKSEKTCCASSGCMVLPGDERCAPVVVDAPEQVALPKLLDLGADKCVPCKMMAPILEELKVRFSGQLEVEFIDVWKDASASETYGVRMIPTQIFFDAEGGELFRHEGFMSEEDLLAKWKELGYVFQEKAPAGESD